MGAESLDSSTIDDVFRRNVGHISPYGSAVATGFKFELMNEHDALLIRTLA